MTKKWWFGKGSSLKYFKTIVILGIHIEFEGCMSIPYLPAVVSAMSVSLVFLQINSIVASSKGVPGLLMKGSWKKCLWNPYFLYITLLSKHRNIGFMKVTKEPPTKSSADDFPTENRSLGRPVIQTYGPNKGSCPSIRAKCWSYLFCVHIQMYPKNQHRPLKNEGWKRTFLVGMVNFQG